MKGELKIICEESGNTAGFLIKRKGTTGNVFWEDLSREEQVRVIYMLGSGFDFFNRCFMRQDNE